MLGGLVIIVEDPKADAERIYNRMLYLVSQYSRCCHVVTRCPNRTRDWAVWPVGRGNGR